MHRFRLSRLWRFPVLLSIVVDLTITILVIYRSVLEKNSLCNASTFADWTWFVNFFEASSFIIIGIVQLCRLEIRKLRTDYIGTLLSTCCVTFLAGASSIINLYYGDSGICEDLFGVRLPGVLLAGWASCVPLLCYIVLTTSNKIKLTRNDKLVLVFIFNAFLSSIGLQFSQSLDISAALLVSYYVSFILSLAFLFRSAILINKDSRLRPSSETSQADIYTICLHNAQTQLAYYLLILLAFFPIIYTATLVQWINNDISYALFMILNVIINCILPTTINNYHFNIICEVAERKLSAESLATLTGIATNESRRLLVRYIMHELRVPLNSIKMGLGYLGQNSHLDEEAKEALLMMDGATGFMKQTLDDVVNIQRIEEGKFELAMAPFSIELCMKHVYSSVQSILKEKQSCLSINIHPSVPKMVIGDAFRIENVIFNLLTNAIKFSPIKSDILINIKTAYISNSSKTNRKSNRTSTISTSTHSTFTVFESLKTNPAMRSFRTLRVNSTNSIHSQHNKGSVRSIITFTVQDHGPGIPPAELPTLFTPFSHIRPHELQTGGGGGGSGVGLVICKQIVELHGGTISCQSIVGKGSTFSFSIPFEVCNNSHNEIVYEAKQPDTYRHSMILNYLSYESSNPEVLQEDIQSGMKSDELRVETHTHSILKHDNHLLTNSNWILNTTQECQQLSPILTNNNNNNNNNDKNPSGSNNNNSIEKEENNTHVHFDNNNNDMINGGTSSTPSNSNSSNTISNWKRRTSVHSISSGYSTVDASRVTILQHCLVVDDVLSNRKLLSMLLRKRGIQCTMACDGQEALDLIQNNVDDFDMIFMDNSMPIMNGVEATRGIRAVGYGNLIIGVTGNALPDDVAEFIAAGADSVILKPISIHQIHQIIEYVMKNGNGHHTLQNNIQFLNH